MPKPLTVWITINWKILKEMGIPDHLTCLLRNLYMPVMKQKLELDMEQQTGDPGIEPGSPALQADSLPPESPGKPLL